MVWASNELNKCNWKTEKKNPLSLEISNLQAEPYHIYTIISFRKRITKVFQGNMHFQITEQNSSDALMDSLCQRAVVYSTLISRYCASY